MKGVTEIELTNIKTGEKEQYVEENMITDAIPDLMRAAPMYYRPSEIEENFIPLWEKAMGGVILFDKTLTENATSYYEPFGVNKVGYSSAGASNLTDPKRGSKNTIESEHTTAFANYYGTGRNFTSNHGGYFYTTIQALDSKWSSTYNTRFILQTIWAASGNDWLEVGFMDGAIAEPGNPIGYHRGYYTAMGKGSTYQEYKIIGPSTTIGTNHNFQIQRDGYNSWGVYVDYTLRRTYSDFATVSSGVDVGLETNNAVSTSAQWHNRNFQLYNGTTWKDWTTGILSNSGVGINVSWNPSYTGINNSKTNPSARSL